MNNNSLFSLLDDSEQSEQLSNFKQIRVTNPDGSSHLVWGLVNPSFQSSTSQSSDCYPCKKGPLRAPCYQDPNVHTCGRTDFGNN